MSQEKKNIKEAIDEADAKLAGFLSSRLSVEDYHEAVELSNIVIDLNIHAFGLAVDANRQKFGVNVDQDITPKILPKEKLPGEWDLKGSDDCEEHA